MHLEKQTGHALVHALLFYFIKKGRKVAKSDKNPLHEFCGDTTILVYKEERERNDEYYVTRKKWD